MIIMRKQVLLVDDDLEMLSELSNVFMDNKIETITADTGQASLEIAQKEPFDIAVVDIKLPDYSGVDLIDLLQEKRPDALYLIITAYASLETAIDAIRMGVFDYIPKPFEPNELIASVETAFTVKRFMEKSQGCEGDVLDNKDGLERELMKAKNLKRALAQKENRIMELKREVDYLRKWLNKGLKYEV